MAAVVLVLSVVAAPQPALAAGPLNVDGGGTAAMYIAGSYKVGPGRLLPTAVLLTKP